MGVQLSDMGAEFNVFANCLAEALVAWKACLGRLRVGADEAVALLVCDLEVAVQVDDVLEAERFGEAARAAERLGREPAQAVNVCGNTLGEHVLEHWIGKRLCVKDLLKTVQTFVTACVLVQDLIDLVLGTSSAGRGTSLAGILGEGTPNFC